MFRYYDYPEDPTLPGKVLRASESDALLASKFRIGVIFQHHNDNPAKFLEPQIGEKDAKQALQLADENHQPFNTAIYFGIDGPEDHFAALQDEYRLNGKGPMPEPRKAELSKTKAGRNLIKYYELFLQYGQKALGTPDLEHIKPEMMNPVIATYFREIKSSFETYAKRNGGNGYKIGIYCTWPMCKLGASLGLKYVWLSPEGRGTKLRHSAGYTELLNKPDALNLVQWPETTCSKWSGAPKGSTPGFDFNQVNSDRSDLGSWDHKRQ